VQQQLEELQLQQDFGILIFFHLGPYSPMLSPIEGCFASLKAGIKSKLVNYCPNIDDFNVPGQVHAHRMHMLEVIFEECIQNNIITPFIVQTQEMHCQ